MSRKVGNRFYSVSIPGLSIQATACVVQMRTNALHCRDLWGKVGLSHPFVHCPPKLFPKVVLLNTISIYGVSPICITSTSNIIEIEGSVGGLQN